MTTAISTYNRLVDTVAIFQPSNKKEWAALSLTCATLLVSSGAAIAAVIGYIGYKWVTAEKLPDPNTVQTIYTPPHPSEADLLHLHSYRDKIAILKKDPQVMGITFAPNQDNKLTPIYIKCTQADNQTYFAAHDLANDTRLGFAVTLPFLKSNEYLKKGHWVASRPEE